MNWSELEAELKVRESTRDWEILKLLTQGACAAWYMLCSATVGILLLFLIIIAVIAHLRIVTLLNVGGHLT